MPKKCFILTTQEPKHPIRACRGLLAALAKASYFYVAAVLALLYIVAVLASAALQVVAYAFTMLFFLLMLTVALGLPLLMLFNLVFN